SHAESGGLVSVFTRQQRPVVGFPEIRGNAAPRPVVRAQSGLCARVTLLSRLAKPSHGFRVILLHFIPVVVAGTHRILSVSIPVQSAFSQLSEGHGRR